MTDFTSPTAYPVFYRTYSRFVRGQRETYQEVCDRCIDGLTQLGDLTAEETALLKKMMESKISLPSGRWLWVGGTNWIEKPENFPGAYNCSSTNVVDWYAFALLMDLAMMGCGTGAVLEPQHVSQLPPIRNRLNISLVGQVGSIEDDRLEGTIVDRRQSDVTIVVGDSRQGWVDSYHAILSLSSDETLDRVVNVKIDLSNVRPAGAKLNGFGGTANPVKLPGLYDRCAQVLNRAIGRQLTSVECCLLIDEAAVTIVAGNIRRCLPGSALVHTQRGLVPIKDIQVGESVQTPIGFRRVLKKFNQGIQPVAKIETEAAPFLATANHRMAVYGESGSIRWVPVEELNQGDNLIHLAGFDPIGTQTSLPSSPGFPTPELTPIVAWLLGFTHGCSPMSGLLACDLDEEQYITWTVFFYGATLGQDIKTKLTEALACFGASLAGCGATLSEATFVCPTSKLPSFLRDYLVKLPTPSVGIPPCILEGGNSIKAAYIAGFRDGSTSPRSGLSTIAITSNDYVSTQLLGLLSSMGIAAKANKIVAPIEQICLVAGYELFNELVAPHSVNGAVPDLLDTPSIDLFRLTPGSEESACRQIEVRDVLPGRLAETYDIEVEEANCFYCNGYLTHNSAGMRQFVSNDEAGATAKDNLWQQDTEGNWRIDPDRDALRMANHTRVYHHQPTEQECIEAVRKQFYSGEGAIQYAPEAIARANADLLSDEHHKRMFVEAYLRSKGDASAYLYDRILDVGTQEDYRETIPDRLQRYGLNPCFAAGTMILTKDGNYPIEELVGKVVDVWDGNQWVTIDNFRVTGENQPIYRVHFGRGGEYVDATPNHTFLVVCEEESPVSPPFFKTIRVFLSDLKEGDLLESSKMPENMIPPRVTKIEYLGVHDKVYCCTVPTNHQITLSNGIITGQCGEILLSDNFCNLAEVHLNQLDPLNLAQQEKAFTAAALSVATLLNHKFQEPRYQKSRELDPIVGVSFTGLFDFFVNAFGVDWLRWWEAGRPDDWGEETIWTPMGRDFSQTSADMMPLSELFRYREREYLAFWRSVSYRVVKEYCDRHGLKCPNRCTTVQPAGSKSLLTGASPGWHPPKAQRFIRRITFAKNDPVAMACIDYGYSVVPSQSDKDEDGKLLDDPFDPRCTEWLVEIPVKVDWADLPGADEIAIEKFSALAQFDFWMQVQKHYTGHNTSATIELREHEIEPLGMRIHQAIATNEGYISSALLARFDDLQTFPRLPFEPIDRETYDRLVSAVTDRRTEGDFEKAIARYDRGVRDEAGPAGCDSDKCLFPSAPAFVITEEEAIGYAQEERDAECDIGAV